MQGDILDAFRKGRLVIAPGITRADLINAFNAGILVPKEPEIEEEELCYVVEKGTNKRKVFRDYTKEKTLYLTVEAKAFAENKRRIEEDREKEYELIPVRDFERITEGKGVCYLVEAGTDKREEFRDYQEDKNFYFKVRAQAFAENKRRMEERWGVTYNLVPVKSYESTSGQ